jgi:hypothetical protein
VLERVIVGDALICVLNEKFPGFLGKQRPTSQELGLMIFAELESVRWSEHATRWLSVFVIVGRRLKIF